MKKTNNKKKSVVKKKANPKMVKLPLRSRKPVPLEASGKSPVLNKDDDTTYTSGHGRGLHRTPLNEINKGEDLYEGLSHFHSAQNNDYDNNYPEEVKAAIDQTI